MNCFSSFVSDVINIRLLKSFLSDEDYHYFLNTSKLLFTDLKRRTVYFALNRFWSNRYITDRDFQRLLLSKVESGWDQIGIQYRNPPPKSLFDSTEDMYYSIPSDLAFHKFCALDEIVLPAQYWNNYKSIRCKCPKGFVDIPSIPNVKELQLYINPPSRSSGISKNLTAFSHLDKLHLNNLIAADITPLKNIPDLTLQSCDEVTDFSVLSRQKKLNILKCSGLTDITSFRSIHTLALSYCHNIHDIRQLNGIYDLTLERCLGIKDISYLGNHHRLTLTGLADDVIGFDCLLHIPHVSLSECNIEYLSVLRYAKSVALSACRNISDVSPLKNVKKIDISSNNILSGLEELREVKYLSLNLLHQQRKDYSDLIGCFHCQRLKLIINTLNISSLSIFSKKIEHLTIGSSQLFANFINQGQGSLLRHLSSLGLISMDLSSLEGLEDIPTIQLVNCRRLRDLRGLGRNRSVKILNCPDLEDVSSLATVPIVTIKNCESLSHESYSCLKNVPRLTLDGRLLR